MLPNLSLPSLRYPVLKQNDAIINFSSSFRGLEIYNDSMHLLTIRVFDREVLSILTLPSAAVDSARNMFVFQNTKQIRHCNRSRFRCRNIEIACLLLMRPRLLLLLSGYSSRLDLLRNKTIKQNSEMIEIYHE